MPRPFAAAASRVTFQRTYFHTYFEKGVLFREDSKRTIPAFPEPRQKKRGIQAARERNKAHD